MNNKYLRITIHDNDYTGCWKELGTTVRNLILPISRVIGIEDVVPFKWYIQHLWYSMFNLSCIADQRNWNEDWRNQFKETPIGIFAIDLDIVDASDMMWNNGEDIYIALFETYDENTNVLLM